MFESNRYSRIYQSIVTTAKKRGLEKQIHDVYLESHHIIPSSLGGSDDSSNRVLLTAREHFLCHLLLTKMTKGQNQIRMKHAFSYMVRSNHPTRPKATSRMFALATKMSHQSRDPEWGRRISKSKTGLKSSPEAIKNMRLALTGRKLSPEHIAKLKLQENLHFAKTFIATDPSGKRYEELNLRAFCREHSLDHQNAWLNMARDKPIAKGPMKGWRFRACI